MCGRFQLLPDVRTTSLMDALGAAGDLLYAPDIAPGAPVSFIRGPRRTAATATWWLLLDAKTGKPNYQYPSFNSRSDRLHEARSLAWQPFRETRCIIPASAFVEGLGDKKTYNRIEFEDQAIAFGGLYRTYVSHVTGEVLTGVSIITLPPLDKWSNIHPKSIPLMLDPANTALVDRWLDPDFTDVSVFADVLLPQLHRPQRITPIDKPSKWNPIGASFIIS